jgi:acyl-CoA thioesterase-1
MARLYITIVLLAAFAGCALGGCSGGGSERASSAAAVDAAAPAAPTESTRLVIFLGDSLTAGYGLPEERSFPSLLAETLSAEGRPIRWVNAGVSGDTTEGGLSRLDWLLDQKPDVLVVGLGANDALRGRPVAQIESDLRAILERSKARGARVLLLGMRIPTNYGPLYSNGFAEIYPKLADQLDIPLVPFLLDGVGGRPELNLPDGIHPNADGQRIVASNVLPYLKKLL